MQTNCILSAQMNTVSRDISRTVLWACACPLYFIY